MKIHIIPQSEFDDFMEEEETNKFGFDLSEVEEQINSCVSVANDFNARGIMFGYNPEVPKHWTEKLNEDLDVIVIEDEDIMYVGELQ